MSGTASEASENDGESGIDPASVRRLRDNPCSRATSRRTRMSDDDAESSEVEARPSFEGQLITNSADDGGDESADE
ncbi:hypothetical protein [Halarchaeum acidiphilum]|uniref:hypothetical protein n=1 Tax=Halarchaeum acidiphilum TaxID=489138 RepID=UPI00131F2DFF|nr:hypothetical protein [Halarchaeum acidiphilum]